MTAPKQTLSMPMLIATSVAAAVGIAALVELKRAPVDPFAALDAVYAQRGEPVPPRACRSEAEAAALASKAAELEALRGLERPSAEASYLLARASFEQGEAHPALQQALACEGFAAAEALAGKEALTAGALAEARAHLERAVAQAPSFLKARAWRTQVLLREGSPDPARAESEAMIRLAPRAPEGFLARAWVKAATPGEDPHADLCAAARLGSEEARASLAAAPCP